MSLIGILQALAPYNLWELAKSSPDRQRLSWSEANRLKTLKTEAAGLDDKVRRRMSLVCTLGDQVSG